jgi:hypothetical protein
LKSDGEVIKEEEGKKKIRRRFRHKSKKLIVNPYEATGMDYM